jgi:hypothetical protein
MQPELKEVYLAARLQLLLALRSKFQLLLSYVVFVVLFVYLYGQDEYGIVGHYVQTVVAFIVVLAYRMARVYQILYWMNLRVPLFNMVVTIVRII